MKVFAICAKIELTARPSWLNEFTAKYNPTWDPHVTLKQPCIITEGKISELKEKISTFLAKNKFKDLSKKIIFNKTVFEKESGIIMALAKEADELIELQKNLRLAFSEYNNYKEEYRKEYEDNFQPHLTLVDRISPTTYTESLKYFTDDFFCEGIIKHFVLIIVNELTKEKSEIIIEI